MCLITAAAVSRPEEGLYVEIGSRQWPLECPHYSMLRGTIKRTEMGEVVEFQAFLSLPEL